MYGSNTFSNFYEYIYTFLNFSFVPWSIDTCCLWVRSRLPLPSPTSLVSNTLVTSFFMAHPLARGFLNSASSIVTPTSTFSLPTSHFVENSCLFLFLLCTVFIDVGLYLCLMRSPHGEYASVINSTSCERSWHLEFLKVLQNTIWPLSIYPGKMKTFVHIKNMYTNFIGTLSVIGKELKTTQIFSNW